MPPATVLSVQHNGTHLAMYLLVDILGVGACYQHFSRETEGKVLEYISALNKTHLILIPSREYSSVKETWLRRGYQLEELDYAYRVQARAIKKMRQRGQTFASLDVERSWPVRGSTIDGPRKAEEHKVMVGRAAW